MRNFGYLSLVLTIGYVGCDSTSFEQVSGPSQSMLTYEGPPVAVLEVSDAVETSVIVPTGGFSLRLDRLEPEGDRLAILYTLHEPGFDESVTQALERLTDLVRVSAGMGPAGIGRIEVRIARVQRGVAYLMPPAHELAAVLER